MTNFLTKTVKLIFAIAVVIIALRAAVLEGIATGLFAAAGASGSIAGSCAWANEGKTNKKQSARRVVFMS